MSGWAGESSVILSVTRVEKSLFCRAPFTPDVLPKGGGIGSARVVFTGPAGEFGDETGANGFFSAELPPGQYRLRVSAEGFDPVKAVYVVPPLSEPIWREKANILREPASFAESQSLYGMRVLVAMPRPGSGPGYARSSEAGP